MRGEGFSIYKPKGRSTWRIEFARPVAGQRIHAGYRDKMATIARARELLQLHERCQAGLIGPHSVIQAMARPLEEIVVDYLKESHRQGRCDRHRNDIRLIMAKILHGTRWQTLGDIRPDTFGEYLRGMAASGFAARTQNHHRAKLRALLNWCVDQGWMATNPVASIKAIAINSARRVHRRRSLTTEEFERLLVAARQVDGRCREPRDVLYAVAAWSGLRRGELVRVLKDDATILAPPRWCIDGARTKNGLAAHLPMMPECAAALAPLWPSLRDGQRLFTSTPNMATWRRDLERAGVSYRDERGFVADFHSLRYTFCRFMSQRFPIEVVSRLMRHSSISLTSDIYLDLGLDREEIE